MFDERGNLMAQIHLGRYTAQIDGTFVVFIIGMRVNRPLAVRRWATTVAAMPPMLRALYRHLEKGFLGGELFLYWPGIAAVQYWRSFKDLERFARQAADPHLAAWRRFNQAVGGDESVGIWHETYLVAAQQSESVYANMPVFGLAQAAAHVPAVGSRETARLRLNRPPEPVVDRERVET